VSQADEEESPLPRDEEAALLAAVAAAWRPDELDPAVHERLLEMALEDPFAEPSAEEQIESARLRDALEQGLAHADAELLHALGAPFTAQTPGHARAVQDAVTNALGAAVAGPAKRTNIVYATFGAAAAVLAVAATALLFVGVSRRAAAPVATVTSEPSAFVKPHSTAPMFADRFETGDTTARIDLIASARSRDLRDNRYASWGVR
jgi:hypothetical protein